MTALHCRTCGREFSEGEQFCSQDGTRLHNVNHVNHDELDGEIASAVSSLVESSEPVAPTTADPLVDTTLDGRYRILRVIGEGGMGVVYEAEHVLIEKHVAIKVLRDTFTGRADVVERFRQEAKSASKIGHPNIVDVSDFGETPSGQSYIVMEMLIGEDLADVLARERALSAPRAVRIAYQIARALHATHKKNIVHRDLKPENIYLVERDGAQDVVKIVDFGVAKMNDVEIRPGRRLTRTGMLFGTPEYMSPEQALGKPFDHRVDIYALGAILFELIAGRVPFTGDNFMEILAHHGHTPLPRLRSVNKNVRVSSELELVMARALAKDPAGRHASMGMFADELRGVPEMGAANLSEILAVSEWAGSTGGFAPLRMREDPTPTRSVSPPPLPERDPTPHRVAVAAREERDVRDVDEEAVTLPRARPPARELPDLSSDLDDAQAAVLLSPGAELRSNAKLGLGLVVLASAVLGVLILQRSHATLRSLPSVHSSAPAEAATPAPEHAAQAATSASALELEELDRLPQPATELRPVMPPGGELAVESDALPVAAPGGKSHTRAGDASRHASAARAEPGLEAFVEVLVKTVPRGASVGALGSDARCEPTPCSLVVPKDRAVTLRAEARNTSVQRTYTFSSEQEVELRLSSGRAKPLATAESTVSETAKPAAAAPHAPSDLKVPSIFR
jgi:serine/threonine protein kinase